MLLATKQKKLHNVEESSREIPLKIFFISRIKLNILFIKFMKKKIKIC